MKKIIAIIMTLVVVTTSLANYKTVQAESSTSITTNKTVYQEGEPIIVNAVSPNTNNKDWICIAKQDKSAYIRWDYTKDMGDNYDIRNASNVISKQSALQDIPVGKYTVCLILNNGAFTKANIVASVDIEVVKFSMDKSVYEVGEPMILTVDTVNTEGKDWICIAEKDAKTYSTWKYTNTITTDTTKTYDITNMQIMPVGEYRVSLLLNDSVYSRGIVASVDVSVVANNTVSVQAPSSVYYVLDNPTSGMADGLVTIQLPDNHQADDIYMWWANEEGKLPGYTSLAKFKVTGNNMVYEMTKNTLIPKGATRLNVYTYSDLYGFSQNYFDVKLPNGAASEDFGTPLTEFQVVSDLHIGKDDSTNQHFIDMLNDVKAVCPNTQGVFTVGDNVNRGGASDQWEKYTKLYESVEDAPNIYLGIGNHEFYGDYGFASQDYEKTMETFLPHVKLPDGTTPTSVNYDFWLNGYHYVFIGRNNDTAKTNMATLGEAQLKWLQETLAENRDGRPIFLFMHEPMPNTIPGSGTDEGCSYLENWEDLKMILDQFPEVCMFNGHTHWILDSKNSMRDGEGTTATIFNTASAGYLWQSYDIVTGERTEGSEGYYVRVYEDKIVVLGRNFETGEWVSSAQFVLEESGLAYTLEDGGVALTISSLEWSESDKAEHNPPQAKSGVYADWIFAGWYTDSTCKTPIENINQVGNESYAKFVKKEILSMKFQVSNGEQKAIRLISSVDSLMYKTAGFQVYDETTGVYNSYSVKDGTVHEKIIANVEGLEYKFSPEIVDINSKYFMTLEMHVTDTTKSYKVRAWWQTFDGTIVTGAERSVSVDDATKNMFEMTVDRMLDTTGTTSYVASFVSSARSGETTDDVTVTDASVTVLSPESVRISLNGVSLGKLASATFVQLQNAETGAVVASGVYRNYYTTYAGPGTEDTSWYDINSKANEFVIASSADLYGLSKIATSYNFVEKTIRQVADISLNDGWTPIVDTNGNLTNGTTEVNSWTPIGSTEETAFAGTFDGQGNKISGIRVESTAKHVGLFGATTNKARIKNFEIENSYIKSTGIYVGAVAGTFKGKLIQNIKVSETVKIKGTDIIGGIAGWQTETQSRSISGCWFAGEIYGSSRIIGGICGRSYRGNNTIENCLVTGMIHSTYMATDNGACVGGFVGAFDGYDSLSIKDSISIATLNVVDKGFVGDIVGRVWKNDSSMYVCELESVYVDNVINHNGTDETANSTGYVENGNNPIDKSDFATKDAAQVVPNLFSAGKNGWSKVTGSYPVPTYWQ